MKEYKLQEEDLLASFRPDLPPSASPQEHPRNNSLAHHHSQHPQLNRSNHHLQRTDGQLEMQRSASPPVVFNYSGQQQLQRSNSAYLAPHFGASPSQPQLVQERQYVGQQQMGHHVQMQPINLHSLHSQSQHSQGHIGQLQAGQFIVQGQPLQQGQQMQQFQGTPVQQQQIQQNMQAMPMTPQQQMTPQSMQMTPQQIHITPQQMTPKQQPNQMQQMQIPQQPGHIQQQLYQQSSQHSPHSLPPQHIPPQHLQPQQMPPQHIPQQQMPPHNVPPQNVPPQGVSPQNVPPQHIPPQYIQHHNPHPQHHPQMPPYQYLPPPQYQPPPQPLHQPAPPYPNYTVTPPRNQTASNHQLPPPHYIPQQQYPPQYYNHPPMYYPDQQYETYPPPEYQQYEYPPEYYMQQQGEFANNAGEYYEGDGQSSLWQERFFYLYEKYEMFYEKYEGITKQTGFLADQFLQVDNEQQWLTLKEKYDLLVERMNEMKDEYALILQEMQDNVQQNQKIEQSNSIKDEAGRVWEHRYHELLEQYESLSHHYAELQSSSMAHNDMDDNERISMLNEKYARLEAEYNHVVQQLQNSPNSMQSRQEHEDLLKYTQQLQGYIEQLESENNTLMKGMKTSVEGSKLLEPNETSQKLAEKEAEIKNLTQMIVALEDKLKQVENRPKSNISKDAHTTQLENQIHEMTQYCSELEQKLSMKEYEINGLKDKVAYLEEQLHLKNEENNNHTKFLQEKLSKIESDISARPPQVYQPTNNVFRLDEDYENRLKEYQKTIFSKNNEIRILQERITEAETDTRKLSFEKSGIVRQWQMRVEEIEEDFRRKLTDKDAKLRSLQHALQEMDVDSHRRAQEKDNTVKAVHADISKLKEEVETRLLEKDMLIKGLRETTTRLENEIKERNTELSRVRSPNMRSPSQSFIMENGRYEEEIRHITEQLERKNDEINKLKKERDARGKQYKDLEQEYESIQEENNKRRIEINNLKRQIGTIENFEYEIENLKATIAKRNQEISDLKNAVFEKDKLKMEIDVKNREIDKANEISRFKSKEIEQLTERNYELQQKLRQKDFKFSNPRNDYVPAKTNHEEIMNLQEEVRKRDIEISKFKIENEEITRCMKRERDQLEALKHKYPAKLKQMEEESSEVKLKVGVLEKRIAVSEAKCKQLQQLNKRVKISITEELNNENLKLKEYYVKFIDRQEEDSKQLKEKIRKYELQLHDYEVALDAHVNKLKEVDIARNEASRKLKSLNDKVEEKEEEIRNLRAKENGQISILRRKEGRFIEVQAQLKSKDYQIKQLEKKVDVLKGNLKALKKEYEDYKHSVIEKMEVSTHKQMENLNKQLADYESRMVFQTHNFDFRVKDKKANQIFERRVIYDLKEENNLLRRELQGKGINISLEKVKITQMQQEALAKSKQLVRKEEQTYGEELKFYRDKNKELEDRVNNHIAVNKNLRERLQYLLAQNNKYEELDKLKIRITELQKREADYQDKISKLQEQNKLVLKEYSSLTADATHSQQLQLQLQEVQRKLNTLLMQKNSLHQELSTAKNERESLQLKSSDLEKQLAKAINQNKMLQAEIERLNQTLSQPKQNREVQDLRKKVGELTRQVSNKDIAVNNEAQKLHHLSSQYESLQDYLEKIEQQLEIAKQRAMSFNGNSIETENWKENVIELGNQLDLMRQRIEELQRECEYYKSHGAGGVKNEVFYLLELISNNYFELQTLAKEMSMQSERMALLGERIAENIYRGMQSCQRMNEVLSG